MPSGIYKHQSPTIATREKMSKSAMENTHGFQKGHQIQLGKHWKVKDTSKMSKASKRKWQNPESAKKMLNIQSPNNQEIFLDNFLKKEFPDEYKFVGDFQFILGGKCPDFINQKDKKIIELFGEHWHEEKDIVKRVKHFEKFGYQVLVIWTKELKDLENLKFRIKHFGEIVFLIPTILTTKAFLKLKYYMRYTDVEISGLGTSRIINSSLIQIKDILLFPQISTSTSTVLKEKSLAKYLYNQTIKNKDVSDINVWIHSHHEMPVFWSITDEHTINNTTSNPFLLSLVINKKLDILGRLDIFEPIRLTIPLLILYPKGQKEDEKIKKYYLRQIKKCVKKPKLVINDRKISLIPIDSKNLLTLSGQEISDLIQQCPWLDWDFHI